MKYVEWVHLIPSTASQSWGDGVVELSQLSQRGIPLAPSFAVNAKGVATFFLQPTLRKAILKHLEGAERLPAAKLGKVALAVQREIAKTEFPKALHAEVATYMDLLEQKVLHTPGGKLPLELTIYGDAGDERIPAFWTETTSWQSVVTAFSKLLMPMFSSESLALRIKNGEALVPRITSVVFRYAPEAELSGTSQCFDADAIDAETIVVEMTKGHQKTHTVDTYKFDRKSLVLLNSDTHLHHVARKAHGSHIRTTGEYRDGEVVATRVARIAKQAQADRLDTVQIFWSIQHSQLVVTGLRKLSEQSGREQTFVPSLLVRGIGCIPGRVTGKARLIRSKQDRDDLQVGEIAVVPVLTEKDLAWLAPAAGVVVETGHQASIEAAVASKLGIVAVSAVHAMLHIRQGQMISLDGYRGEVHAGRVQLTLPVRAVPSIVTATKVLASIEDPLHVHASAFEGSDGIGLLRGEFLLKLSGLHPHEVYEKELIEDYREILSEVVEKTSRLAYPLPVTYQLHDLSEETRGRHRHEPNPKLGYKGSHRILEEPELVAVEVEVLASLMRSGLENVRVLLPAVRSTSEVVSLISLISRHWPAAEPLPEIWARCAAPSLLIGARDLCETGVTGVIFDVPILAELIHGFDGDNHQVGHHLTLDHEAVLDAINFAIATCRSEGIQTAIIAEGYQMQPRVLEEAVLAGLQEVIAPASQLPELRKLLASIEQRVVLDHARGQAYQEET